MTINGTYVIVRATLISTAMMTCPSPVFPFAIPPKMSGFFIPPGAILENTNYAPYGQSNIDKLQTVWWDIQADGISQMGSVLNELNTSALRPSQWDLMNPPIATRTMTLYPTLTISRIYPHLVPLKAGTVTTATFGQQVNVATNLVTGVSTADVVVSNTNAVNNATTWLTVQGSNFVNSTLLVCRIGAAFLSAVYVSPTTLLCPLPDLQFAYPGAVAPFNATVDVSNNGQVYMPGTSSPANQFLCESLLSDDNVC